MATEMTTLDKLEFCCVSANTPMTIEETYPLGKHTVAIEGWFNPDDGDLRAMLEIAFRRYFHRITATVNVASEDMGYYRFSARLTEKKL